VHLPALLSQLARETGIEQQPQAALWLPISLFFAKVFRIAVSSLDKVEALDALPLLVVYNCMKLVYDYPFSSF
jgi:hypothetical protein